MIPVITFITTWEYFFKKKS